MIDISVMRPDITYFLKNMQLYNFRNCVPVERDAHGVRFRGLKVHVAKLEHLIGKVGPQGKEPAQVLVGRIDPTGRQEGGKHQLERPGRSVCPRHIQVKASHTGSINLKEVHNTGDPHLFA